VDIGQDQEVSKVPCPYREEPGLQPHDVPEACWRMRPRVLLALQGRLVQTRIGHRRILSMQHLREEQERRKVV